MEQKIIQGDLFYKPFVFTPVKRRFYKDLSIHERINVKANSQGFQSNYINQLRRGFDAIYNIRRDEHPECLMPIWFLHIKLNKNSILTILWRKKCLENKMKLKFAE